MKQKSGVEKDNATIGRLRSMSSATAENVETKCSDGNPNDSRLRQKVNKGIGENNQTWLLITSPQRRERK